MTNVPTKTLVGEGEAFENSIPLGKLVKMADEIEGSECDGFKRERGAELQAFFDELNESGVEIFLGLQSRIKRVLKSIPE
jgi:hypothetical protein